MLTPDQIIRTRRKTIAFIIERDGTFIVRAPLRASNKTIQELIAKKEKWIRAKQSEVRQLPLSYSPKKFVEGERFWYLGETYPLQLVDGAKPALILDGNFRLSRSALPEAREVFEGWYRGQAQRLLSERVEQYAREHGYAPKQIRITSARTRWGSCSSRGTLSFPWRLAMAPLEVIDYLIIHELAHLKISDHSKQFWSRVEEILPDYRLRRERLKKNGHLLNLE